MPTLPRAKCSQPDCFDRSIKGSSYCQAHTRKEYSAAVARRVLNPFYNSAEWKRARLLILNNEPLCRGCRAKGHVTPATVVDHIIPISQSGSKLDPSNLQPLCASCHNQKTLLEKK